MSRQPRTAAGRAFRDYLRDSFVHEADDTEPLDMTERIRRIEDEASPVDTLWDDAYAVGLVDGRRERRAMRTAVGRDPVRIKVYGGSLVLLPPGTDWRVERITEHVAPGGLIGEVLPEWTIIDLSPIEAESTASSEPLDRCDVIVNSGMGEPTECGRTLPCEYHSPALPEPQRSGAGLDVERLARAWHMTQRCVHGKGSGEPMQLPGYLKPDREVAADIVDEYARLSKEQDR